MSIDSVVVDPPKPESSGFPKWAWFGLVFVAIFCLGYGMYRLGQTGPAEKAEKLAKDNSLLVAALIHNAKLQACAAKTAVEAGNARAQLKRDLQTVGVLVPVQDEKGLDFCVGQAGTREPAVKKSASPVRKRGGKKKR